MKFEGALDERLKRERVIANANSKNTHIWKIPAFIILIVLTLVSGFIVVMKVPSISVLNYSLDAGNFFQNMFTILLASIIGSVIGWERENKNRPAGLRTYSLVCMGSALVMITSYEIFNNYHTLGNFDPARLGAQVISGIGFLGAGTIIRDKFSVKGLTTAASLWVVACIGLTVGAQMYVTSIMISAIVYYVMHNLRCMDDIKVEMMNYEIVIRMKEQTGQIREVHKVLDKYRINVRDINISYGQKGLLEEENDDLNIVIHALIMDQFVDQLIIEFNNINGITSFYFSEL